MKFILNKDTLIVESGESVNSGSLAYYEAAVEYDESWNDLSIEAILIKEDKNKGTSIAVIDNKMYVDQQLKGEYSIGFVGYKIEEDKKVYQISTNLKSIYFNKGAGEIETENVEVPTPTEWEIYTAQIQEFIREGQVVVDEANNLNVELKDNILTITKKDGTKYSENVKGDKGGKGDAGAVKIVPVTELPSENIEEDAIYLIPNPNPTSEKDRYLEFVYVNNDWELWGSGGVSADLTDYVKNTDYPADKAGVVKVNPTMYGIGAYPTTGYLYITPATEKEIDEKKHSRRAIVPEYVDYTVKSGLADSKLEWTEEEKANARNLLNTLKKSTQNRCLYGNSDGVEKTYIINYANEATVNSIPFRALNGAIMITDASCKDGGSGAIPDGEQAVNKNYVKASIVEAVGNIETLLGGI